MTDQKIKIALAVNAGRWQAGQILTGIAVDDVCPGWLIVLQNDSDAVWVSHAEPYGRWHLRLTDINGRTFRVRRKAVHLYKVVNHEGLPFCEMDADAFASLCEQDTPLGKVARNFYNKELDRMMKTGRVVVEKQIAKLWPIIRDVNDETDEAKAQELSYKRRSEAAKSSWKTRLNSFSTARAA